MVSSTAGLIYMALHTSTMQNRMVLPALAIAYSLPNIPIPIQIVQFSEKTQHCRKDCKLSATCSNINMDGAICKKSDNNAEKSVNQIWKQHTRRHYPYGASWQSPPPGKEKEEGKSVADTFVAGHYEEKTSQDVQVENTITLKA